MDWSTLFPFLAGGFPTDPYAAAGGSYAPAPLPPNPFAGPGFSNPGVMDASLAGAPYQAPGSTAGSVGGNVANAPGGGGIGSDYARSPGGSPEGGAPYGGANAAQARAATTGDTLQTALRGMQALSRPTPQTVRTPPPPQVRPADPAALINLLSSLGIGPHQAAGIGLFRR